MSSQNDIAIVGMAAHLPGAATLDDYWRNLEGGIESIRTLSEAELLAAGETPERIAAPDYVRAAAPLEGFDQFDGEFFGFGPKEAAILDPQHRQLMEVAWEALENAGHPPETFDGRIGVFAGCGMGSYFHLNLCSNPDLVASTGMFLLRHTGNDKDFLATRISHVLDLKGPSVGIQTACSTSLVAIHYACRALLSGECDLALAGGVTIELPHGRGYLFKEGEILSPDGHCRAFDHRAAGTVFGSGAGVVALRRLADARAGGDHIWAVIKGSAVNNDGADKAGYLAPSVEGQAQAIAAAHAAAGVDAGSIGYVECHGTGTYLGDPIEVAALTAAFRRTSDAEGACRIGSVKTNIGHTDTAAGVAGLIKTALCLHHRAIPPSLGFERPSPALGLARTPFRVADRLAPWPAGPTPRRAGVNSLGVGGTNAHLVLEEAPPPPPAEPSDWPVEILTVSGRTRAALEANAAALAAHLAAHPGQPLADVAFTLKAGRRAFEHRRVLVAASAAEAARLLAANDPRRVFTHRRAGDAPEVVFMFPGGGAQHAGMARDLYETEPVVRDWIDRGLAALAPRLDLDLRALWLAAPAERAAADARLLRPSLQLPLILIVEVALAQLWISWGVRPAALIGHSMGENTAACLAGVMDFEACIGLVHCRGQLFDTLPAGGMLSIPLPAAALAPRLGPELDLAAVNAPALSVASGPADALETLAASLAADGIEARRIPIDVAAHSRGLAPILGAFEDHLRTLPLAAPTLPILSNRTGRPLTADEATDPGYWTAHLRGTVDFAAGIRALAATPGRIFLEVGPGRALATLAQANGVAADRVVGTLRHPDDPIADDAHFLQAFGRLDALGLPLDWTPIWGGARRRRLPLPTYAFQRRRAFIEPGAAPVAVRGPVPRHADLARWGWRPDWRPRLADAPPELDAALAAAPATWLLFADTEGIAARLARRLRAAGHRVLEVHPGDRYARDGDRFRLAPEAGRAGYDTLLAALAADGLAPARIVHLALLGDSPAVRPGSSRVHATLEQGFYALVFLAQALTAEPPAGRLALTVVTSGALRVGDEPLAHPEKRAALTPLSVLARELPHVTALALDVELPPATRRHRLARARRDPAALDALAERLLEDLLAEPRDPVAAFRGPKRLARGLCPVPLAPAPQRPLQAGDTVLVTGGLGGIGLTIAEHLATTCGARLALVGRASLPERAAWPAHLTGHDDATAERIRALQALEARGAEVLYLSADAADLAAMRDAVATAIARFGRIDAVIHAAGTLADAPIATKTPAGIEAVLAAKVHGTRVLDTLFPDGSLKWMALFSSTSTFTTPPGQVDYVAASDVLNAFAESRRGGQTRVVAIDWGIWAEVGMAADAMAARNGAAPPRRLAGTPLLAEASRHGGGTRTLGAILAPSRHWLLAEHRTGAGRAILPGTGIVELAAEALRAEGVTGAFEIRDLAFLRPLEIAGDAERAVRVRLTPDAHGFGFALQSACEVDGRPAFTLNAEATLTTDPEIEARRIDLAAIAARCPDVAIAAEGATLRSPQETHLAFGPRWRVLHQTAYGAGEGLAELALDPAFADDLVAGFRLHPALLDLATGWAMQLIPGYVPTHLWVPVAYRRIAVHADLPAEIRSFVRLRATPAGDGTTAELDVTLTAPDGHVLVEIEGFTLRRLAADAAFGAAPPPTAHEVEFADAAAAPASRSPAEARLADQLARGIRPAEGAEAFDRALAAGLPQIAVSALDLAALVEEAGAAAAPEPAAVRFDRPALVSDYLAPRTEIERRLAGFWQELLGVGEIGVEDGFFDLGGHSLIAVRLFAMIRKAYGVELPISVLFEAPTIARCAALLAERIGTDEAGAPPAAAVRSPSTHLVAMHEGEGGDATPFFLVAGMFGNVLNLRHLARLVGGERRFFGLQARGLFGDAPPHDDFVSAARDLIAEIRTVQPHGPYLLGGFSGGGIAAFEMARQLEAAGEPVALVVLLDTPLPQRPRLSLRDRALIKVQRLAAEGPAFLATWARDRLAWEARRRSGPPEASEPGFHNARIEAAFRTALARYEMARWDGRLVLFRPRLDRRFRVGGGRWVDGQREYLFEDNDWTRWAPRTEVEEVPGDHDSMVLEPNVRALAARLRAAIAAAEAGQGRAPAPPLATAAE